MSLFKRFVKKKKNAPPPTNVNPLFFLLLKNKNLIKCVALLANACFEVFLVSTIKDKPSFRWVCWIKDKNDKLDWAILSQYVNESLSEYQYLFLAAIMSFIIIMSCTINLNKVIWKAYFWKKLLSMQNANVNPFLHKLTVRISMK